MKRICIFSLTFVILILFTGNTSYAGMNEQKNEETSDELEKLYSEYADFDLIDDEVDSIINDQGYDMDISFSDIYSMLIEGNVEGALNKCIECLGKSMTGQMLKNRELLLKLLILIVIAAVFNNYSSVLKFSYVGEQGFFVTYLMSAALLLKSFFIIFDMAKESVMYISDAMRCMLPAFTLSLVVCSGAATSQMTSSIFLFVSSVMEKILLYIVLPMIRIYFLIILLNQLNGKDRFSKLAELIKHAALWIIKGFITAVVGLDIFKSMLVPVYENVRYNMLQKGLTLIPGASSVSGLSGIFIGAAVLIKNCVGVTAMVILIMIGSVPVLKILFFYISYRLVLAAAQPISDQRILMGIQGACDSTGVLLKTVLTSIALCVLSITIIILSTNLRMYS